MCSRLAPQRLAGEDDRAGIDELGRDLGRAIGVVDDRAQRAAVDEPVLRVGRERDRRLVELFPRHRAIAARQMLGETLHPHAGEDDLRPRRADIDADGDQLDIVGLPQPVDLRIEIEIVIVVIVEMIASDLVQPDRHAAARRQGQRREAKRTMQHAVRIGLRVGRVQPSGRGLHQLDPRMMAGRGGDALIAREQRRVERLREGDIDCVIGGEIVLQVPNPLQQEIVRIAPEGKVGQIDERFAAALPIDLASGRVPARRMRDFDINQMGCVQRLAGINNRRSTASAAGLRSSDSSKADASTTITDDRARRGWPLRGRRTSIRWSVAPDAPATPPPSAVRRHRGSRRADSRRRLPASAARDFSRRCNASGTLRI